MEYESKLDIEIHESELIEVNVNNYETYLEKWLEHLNQDIIEFKASIESENLLDIELSDSDILDMIILFHKWVTYLRNSFVALYDQNLKVKPKKGIRNFSMLLQELNEVVIRKLDAFQRPFSLKYQKNYLKDLSDKLFTKIKLIEDILLEVNVLTMFVSYPADLFLDKFTKVYEEFSSIDFLLQSLIRLDSQRTSTMPIIDLLMEFRLNQVKDCVERANQFFSEERWDKVVTEMRIAFDVVVTWLVRRIQNNSNWKAPIKDGLEILRQKGIITDEFVLNQMKTKNIGLYGFLSIKGHHPNGESTENLADSDLEASYCLELTNAAITYLLKSFKKSPFYEATE